MISMERAACALDAAADELDDARADGWKATSAAEFLGLARDCFDRNDWTGAWLWAGNALAHLRGAVAA